MRLTFGSLSALGENWIRRAHGLVRVGVTKTGPGVVWNPTGTGDQTEAEDRADLLDGLTPDKKMPLHAARTRRCVGEGGLVLHSPSMMRH